MAISYILGKEYNVEDLCQLAHQVGWKDWEPELINKCYQSAYLVATVRQDAQLIGNARVMSDGYADAVIFDLMIRPDVQNQGIGAELLKRVIRYLEDQKIYAVHIFYPQELTRFYAQFGFRETICGSLYTRPELGKCKRADSIIEQKQHNS